MTALPRVRDLAPATIQRITDTSGLLVVAEAARHVPFDIRRAFVVTVAEDEALRGHHAHKQCNQMLACLRGRVVVRVWDGEEWGEFVLEQDGAALHIPPGIWGEQIYRSSGDMLMVLCDLPYDEDDYLRDADDFVAWRRAMDGGNK